MPLGKLENITERNFEGYCSNESFKMNLKLVSRELSEAPKSQFY